MESFREEAEEDLEKFISSCVEELEIRKEEGKRSPFPKNAITRDFKTGMLTFRYLETAVKAKHLLYATEMIQSFRALSWEEQTEHRGQVLKAIFKFCDSISLWQKQSFLLVRSFYCIYFRSFHRLMFLSNELCAHYPRFSRRVCEWLLSVVRPEDDWAVVRYLLKSCQGYPEEVLVEKFILSSVQPTQELLVCLFALPVFNAKILDHFFKSIPAAADLPSFMTPLFKKQWDQEEMTTVQEILRWSFDKMQDIHPCHSSVLKLMNLARRSKHAEILHAVQDFSDSQTHKKCSTLPCWEKKAVNEFVLKQYVQEAVKANDWVALVGLLSCDEEGEVHERIQKWKLFSKLLANNQQRLLQALISDLNYKPSYEDVSMSATKANFSFILSLNGRFLTPWQIMLEAIHAGECEKIIDIIRWMDEKEMRDYILKCYEFRSINSIEVLIKHFPHTPIPLSIHEDDCPWIEGTQTLLNGVDSTNDVLHSVFCFANLEKVLYDRHYFHTRTSGHRISYFLQALCNIRGSMVPRTVAEFVFHPYDLRILNSCYLREFKVDFNKGWVNMENSLDYNGYDNWRYDIEVEKQNFAFFCSETNAEDSDLIYE